MPKPNQVAIFFKFAEANPHSRGSLPSLVRHVNLPRLPTLPNSPPGPSPLHRDRPLNKDKTGLAWPPGLPPCSPLPGTLRGTTRKGGDDDADDGGCSAFSRARPQSFQEFCQDPNGPWEDPLYAKSTWGAPTKNVKKKGWRSKFACKSYTNR